MGKAVFSFREGFRLLGLLVAACPAGAAAQPLAAGCLLAAMPLRDSSCPVGAVPPRMGRNPCGENRFFFCGKAGCFYFALVFACPAGATAQPLAASPPYGWGVPPAGKTTFSFAGKRVVFTLQLVFAYPAGAKTTFSFAYKRKSGSGLRKRKGRPVEILGWCVTTG